MDYGAGEQSEGPVCYLGGKAGPSLAFRRVGIMKFKLFLWSLLLSTLMGGAVVLMQLLHAAHGVIQAAQVFGQ